MPVGLEGLGDPADCLLLVLAAGNRTVDRGGDQRLGAGAALDDSFQFVAGVKALHCPRRVGQVVPELVLVAVGEVDQRAPAVRLLQAIGLQLGLVLPLARIVSGSFGIDNGQGPAVVAPQHVVDLALLAVRHSGYLELGVPVVGQRPTGLAEQQVDEPVPSLLFVVVVGVDLACVCRLGCGNLFLPDDDFASVLAGVTVAVLATSGPLPSVELAAKVFPLLGHRWVSDGHSLTEEDVRMSIAGSTSVLTGLDLIEAEWPIWRAGPSAVTLLHRATALAHLWSAAPE